MQEKEIYSCAGEEKDRQFVTALARGLELLRCFGSGSRYLSNAELSAATGIPKPTVSRLTYTLTKLGYLMQSPTQGTYRLAGGILSLGYSMLANLDVRQMARPEMRELAEHANASVALGMRDRLNMVYVETCTTNSRMVTLRLGVGSRIPLATTAMGKAFLCGLPQEEQNFLLDHIRLHEEVHWPRIKAGIEQAFRDYEEKGFCMSVGEWQSEVHSVGVPLSSEIEGETPMAFNCGGPAYLLNREILEEDLGPRLVKMVKRVEATLGRG